MERGAVPQRAEKDNLKGFRGKSLFYFLHFKDIYLKRLRWPFSTHPLDNHKSFEDGLIKIELQVPSFPPYITPIIFTTTM